MLAQERYEVILEMLKESNIVKISDIVGKLQVSNETARRDLETLQDQKYLKRVHGGAILTESINVSNLKGTLQSLPKTGISYAEKKSIGKMAASLVKEGETILLDIGSTTLEIAKNLKSMHNLTVLTTALPIVNELVGSNVTIVVLGGKLLPDDQIMYSPFTSEVFEKYYVDKSFIGCGGVSLDGGVTDYSEYCLDRKIIKSHSYKMILVADSGKFGHNALVQVCPLTCIDIIVSDSNLNQDYIDNCKNKGVEMVIAPMLHTD